MTRQFAIFLMVGVLNTIFGYSIFSLFVYLGLHYSLALFLATIVGILFNFKSISRIVFKTNDNSLFLKFILVYAVVFAFNLTLLSLLVSAGFNDYVGGFLALIPSALLAFYLNKKIVYKGIE